MGASSREGAAAKQRWRQVAKVFRMPGEAKEGGAGCRLGGLGLAGKPAGLLLQTGPWRLHRVASEQTDSLTGTLMKSVNGVLWNPDINNFTHDQVD